MTSQSSQPSTAAAAQTLVARSSSIDRLAREWFRFDFFQAVRLLELATNSAQDDGPSASRNPVGKDFAPNSEAVRFGTAASQSFAGSTLMAYVPGELDAATNSWQSPAKMTVSFMGLTGPSGVLPQHYTQRLIDQLREDDGMREFFDIFNHRAISHFYGAWKKYRFPLGYESASLTNAITDRPDHCDRFTFGLFCLLGLGTRGLRGRQEYRDESLLFYAGQLVRQPRSAISLERVLRDYFDLPTEVIQFVGQWLTLEAYDRTYLAASPTASNSNHQLGVTAIAGERVWSIENKFRVRLGPLNYDDFWELTPQGGELTRLAQFIRTFVGPDLDFDVQLVLKRNQVPPCQLTREGNARPHLGWNTWIRSGTQMQDAEDTVFLVEGLPTR